MFEGFRRLDVDQDGFLSLCDLECYFGAFNTRLPIKHLTEILFMLDDSRRGSLTFEDVMLYFLRVRSNYFSSQQAVSKPLSSSPRAINNNYSDEIKERPILDDAQNHSMLPLLLYRLLVFASFQEEDGTVHLLTALQVWIIRFIFTIFNLIFFFFFSF